MMRLSTVFVLGLAVQGAPAIAQASAEKVETCGYQAAVVSAIQQARLDRVRERKVQERVLENATWPENFNTAIPLLTPWVYEMKMRDVREQDLAAAWTELCLQQ
ncbi:hypothetical protein Z945_1372 [Sulfitobacter noctilucae]|uniref:hypothetical protein n=1 Tax=Sulfitobacter noctilucae TaxID=1342302 RepID=UPI0004687B1E|nr:hypothetical protein [Sulfitobacter noctilucae]KIN60401.1 hypothetical protein Z945_1372 [Sulfitobacter noctilucae]